METGRKVWSVPNIVLTGAAKCFADWPIEVQSVLLTRQLFMNTADRLCSMTIAECVVQLVIDSWPSRNAKMCTLVIDPHGS